MYERLLDQYAEMLTLADQTWYKPKNRSHVPDWAFMVFAGCAGLLGLMALGCVGGEERVDSPTAAVFAACA